MIISLGSRPPTNRRLRTGSRLEGVSIHSSRHTNAPQPPTNHPDLICHILTSSPSIHIRSLPCSGPAHTSAAVSFSAHYVRWHLWRRPRHDMRCLFPRVLEIFGISSPAESDTFYLQWPVIRYTESALLYVPYSALNRSRPRLSSFVPVIPCKIVYGNARARIYP